MNLQSNPKSKRITNHGSSGTSSIEPDIAQQLIAEIGFSCLDRKANNANEIQQKRKKKQQLSTLKRIGSSPIGFGQTIEGHKIGDSCFQQMTDSNGLSWWYDTSEDSDESSYL